MATIQQARANIADYLSRADIDSVIFTAIQRAVEYYGRLPFFFNEATTAASLTTSSSQSAYNVPDDFIEDLNLVINYNGSRYKIPKRDHQFITSIDVSNIYGQPSFYSIYNGQIHYYPVPNASHTVSLTYIKRLATLSASADTNAFLTDANDLIEARAMWWVASRKMRKMDLAQVYKQEEMEALEILRRQTSQRATSNRVRSYGL
jgi:hypothetical protein